MESQQHRTDREVVLDVQHLSISFGDNHVLRDFNLQLYRGENLVVLGKSGSGKSVLIKCIIGLLKPDHGQIRVLGQDVIGMSKEELDRMRTRVGFLFQSNALYDSMTVRENLEFPLRRHGRDKSHSEVEALVMEALTNVGLPHTVDLMPSELSGGMRKRVALARTMILKPEIMLYDEPTTGLDPVTSREINDLILKVQQIYKTSSIIISHDMSSVFQTSNRIAVLIDGRCSAEGNYDQLTRNTDPAVQGFFQ
ncbi:MAG: ABC transporter ATP-binding protein [Saprospiraceae bacterium]|nr:ABC transporter ATP-binding protein [Saprospiraceae bacterium]MCB9312202.1 ABC transporter ATP-binding protein [Lewinellaceae bacterium]HRW76419.1 ABC transporter ATP-binding protein [Saprospiraceae bacterium]